MRITSTIILLFFVLSAASQDDLYKPVPKAEAVSIKNLNEVKVFTHKKLDGTTELIEIPFVDGDVVFEKVLELENNTTTDILKKAKIVMIDFARSAKDMTQLIDEDNMILIAKGWSYLFTSSWHIHFTLKIECRDNRYKMTIYNLKYELISSNGIFVVSDPESSLQNGVKKTGYLKSHFWGYAFVDWRNFANQTFELFNEKMPKVSLNKGNDW